MNISKFVNKAIKQDKRNTFGKGNLHIKQIPDDLQKFYKEIDPINVEVNIDGNYIHFYPENEILKLQEDYHLDDGRFVFATNNSDPIYLYRGKVYTCYHAENVHIDEFLANSFNEFLDMAE